MQHFFENWKQITSDQTILNWIKGFKIPFVKKPFQKYVVKNPKWSNKEITLIKEQLSILLKKKAIRKCSPDKDQFISSIFLVPKPDGSSRLILNLKNLNTFIKADHFKIEDFKVAIQLLTENCWMCSVDLTDAYYMISIVESDRKFLRFEFLGQLYEFNVLPFGLNIAPYIFTKIMKPVLVYLRLRGLIFVCYLDDFLLLDLSLAECKKNLYFLISVLTCLGFLVKYEKSKLIPSKRCKFLGLIFNSAEMSVELPLDKKEMIFKRISFLEKMEFCKIREFAELIGQLNFATNALQYSPVYLKRLEYYKYVALLKNFDDYDANIFLNNHMKEDLKWWKSNIFTLTNPVRNFQFKLEIFSDASLTGWGASCELGKTHGWWNPQERELHINLLELRAAFYGLRCFAQEFSNCNILLRIDNTTAISYINRMGGVQFPELNQIAREIWQWCESKRLWIFASYIKSADNVVADEESRLVESNSEYQISHDCFLEILNHFGDFEIDLFASRVNAKCQRYISWFKDPYAESVDAFTVNWNKVYFYAFPPFSIILRVLNKIKREGATGLVVVPFWPSQPWFPVFNKMLIKDPIYFGPNINLLCLSNRDPHPLWRDLILVAGLLSGKPSL